MVQKPGNLHDQLDSVMDMLTEVRDKARSAASDACIDSGNRNWNEHNARAVAADFLLRVESLPARGGNATGMEAGDDHEGIFDALRAIEKWQKDSGKVDPIKLSLTLAAPTRKAFDEALADPSNFAPEGTRGLNPYNPKAEQAWRYCSRCAHRHGRCGGRCRSSSMEQF